MKKVQRVHKGYIVLAIGFAILVTGYLSRGWVRGSLASWFATKKYGPLVDRAFEKNVTPISQSLRVLGVRVVDQKDKTTCVEDNFSWFRETITCSKYGDNAFMFNNESAITDNAITPALSAAWREGAATLQSQFETLGWKVDTSHEFSDAPKDNKLANLMDNTSSQSTLVFAKTDGTVECYYEFMYLPVYALGNSGKTLPASLAAWNSCTRSVDIFGGWPPL
jgi:hypothetical protein